MLYTFIASYEGEESQNTPTEPTDPQTQSDSKSTTPKTFTQDDVNRILAEEKRKFSDKQQKQLTELEQLRKTFKGTTEEKQRLEAQIEVLKNETMTAEERAKSEKEKLRKEAEADKKTLETDRDLWKNRYTESTIAGELTRAAVDEGAISPEPILAILRSATRLAPVIDKETGKETPNLTVKVRMRSKNDKGEEVELDFSPGQAVKKMKEDTNRYGYLFRGDKNPGLGGNHIPGTKNVDVKNMSPDEYRKNVRGTVLKK